MPAPMPASGPVYRNTTCTRCGGRGRAVDLAPCTACGACMTCGCTHEVRPHLPAADTRWHGEPSGLFPRYVGLEIECGANDGHGSAVIEAARAWGASVVGDGSVHAGRFAMEVVTAPARGAAVEAQVRDLCRALARQGAVVDKTCGLHVHVDARDQGYLGLCRISHLWSKVEASLFNVVAPSRRKKVPGAAQHYCQPWGLTFERAGVFLAESEADKMRALDCAIYGNVQAAAVAKRPGNKYHGSRYRSLNLHAFHVHGTVEARLHHGTTDADKIVNWAAVCCGVVHYAVTHTDEEIAALRGTPAEILDRVVTSPTVRAWMVKRREHFAALRSRRHPGQPPRRRAPAPPQAPVPAVPVGPREASEV